MKCRICGNAEGNQIFQVQEKQHCLKDWFPYFKCANCDCIQIVSTPGNMDKYYPESYYSFHSNKLLNPKLSFFHKVQSDYLIYGKSKLLGPLFTLKYQTPKLFSTLKNLDLNKKASVLDIGSGTGDTLKKMYELGYKNLTGVDPYIKENLFFTESFHIYKKDPLQLSTEKKFDCIMMHHSFEHIEFQRPVLQKIKQLLNKQGKLLIRIPVYSETLWNRYGANAVFLDAPRHFFIHSIKSMKILCNEAGLTIDTIDYDADEFSIWASEEYAKGICLSDKNSFAKNRKKSIFSKKEIKSFAREIQKLNEEGQSDAAAFYISSSSAIKT
jgi:SAM-dependent methyltransferase